MYQYHWFLLLLFCVFTSFSGQTQEERIFIDYSACTKGLIAANGDTVIPASYDYLNKARVISPSDPKVTYSNYWLVQSGEERGLFDENYQVILPLKKHQILLVTDNIIKTVIDDTVVQLHHALKRHLQSDFYSEIRFTTFMDSVFICRKGDSTQFLDFELNLLGSLPYTNISPFIKTASSDKIPQKLIFRADSAEYSGFVNSKGELSVLSKDEKISPCCRYSERAIRNRDLFFLVRDSQNKYGLRNLTGSVHLPNEYDRVQVFIHQRFKEDNNTLAFAYLWKNDSMQMKELHSGIASKFYKDVQFYEGYHVAFNDDKSFILNEQFLPIDSLEDVQYLFKTKRDYVFRNYDEDYPYYYNQRHDTRLRRSRNIAFVGHRFVSSKQRRKAKLQLHNFQTGETIKDSYNSINLFSNEEGAIYYHAANFRWSKYWFLRKRYLRRGKIAIYDSTFNIVSEYTGRTMYDLTAKGTGALILENKHKKQGVISIQGDTIIPFEYDNIHYQTMPRYSMEAQIISANISSRNVSHPPELNDSFFLVTNKGKKGMYNLKGQVLIPEIYKNLKVNNGSVIAYTDTVIYHFDCCDTIKEVYQSEYGKPLTKPKRRKRGKRRKQKKQPKNKIKFFEEDGIYYVSSSLYDSTWKYRNARNRGDMEYVARNKRIINRNSAVVYKTKNKRINIYTSGGTYFFFDDNNAVFLDSTGILKVEEFPKKRESQITGDLIIVNNHWKNKNLYSGMYSIEKLDWIFPIEENYELEIENHTAVMRGNSEDGYRLYDITGEQKNDHIFPYLGSVYVSDDYIYLTMYDTNSYFDKVALLDTNFNYILPPSYGKIEWGYSKIAEYRDTNNNLTLINGTKKLSFPKVKIKYASDRIYLFKQQDSVAYIDHDLNFEMPFTYLPDLFKTERFKSILFGDENAYLNKLVQVHGVNLSLSKRNLIENHILWPYLQKNDALGIHNWESGCYPAKTVGFDTASVPVHRGRKWIGKGSYEVAFRQRNYVAYNNMVHCYEYYDTTYRTSYTTFYTKKHSKKKIPRNYSEEFNSVRIDTSYLYLTDTALVPLPNFKYVEPENRVELRALLLKKLNEAQALGLRCANIEGELNHLENNFNIAENGIHFWGIRNLHSIKIPYFELIGIWKNPYALKLDQLLDESP